MCSSPNSDMTICGYRDVMEIVSLDETIKVGPCIDMMSVLTGRDARKFSFSQCHVRIWKETVICRAGEPSQELSRLAP